MSNRQLIDAENIKISFGQQLVLDFERFQLYEGEKIGLVGVNGAGKSTLIRILSGEMEPDQGYVRINCEPFYFQQFQQEWDSYELDGKEIKTMGVRDQIWQDQVSGGENTRIRLAEMFGSHKAVAFLDEPSANLDKKGIELLKQRLKDMDSFVLISHDRALMNEVCNHIVELEYGKLKKYPGNYDVYVELKEAERNREWAEYDKYQSEKKRLQKVYQEKKNKARKIESKPHNMSASDAKVRNFIGNRKIEDKARNMEKSATNVMKRISHMEVKKKPREIAQMRPDFRLTNPPENPIVIKGEHISFAYNEGSAFEKKLYDDASFYIYNKSKLAILGDNGVGKTTLLNMIIEADQVLVVPGAKIGYLSQNLSEIKADRTVLENIMNVSVQKEEIARVILSRLLLSEQDMKKTLDMLSGGERMKLAFAMLLVSDANILVLDEPTNYLDIPSIEALERLLQEYEGTLVFVSHDMEFVKNVATDVFCIENCKIVKQ